MGVGAKAVISSAIALLVFAITFPISMAQIIAANITGWNAAVTIIFTTLVPVVASIGIALKFVPGGRGG